MPAEGETDNQLPPVDVLAAALKPTDPPEPALATASVCDAGLVPLNCSDDGVTCKEGVFGAVIVNVTGTVCGVLLAPTAATVTVPSKLPTLRPAIFTETEICEFKDPAFETESHG